MKKYIIVTIAFALTVLGSFKLYSGYERSLTINDFNEYDIYCSNLLDLPITPNQDFCSGADRFRNLLDMRGDIMNDNRGLFAVLGLMLVCFFLSLTIFLFDREPQIVHQEDH